MTHPELEIRDEAIHLKQLYLIEQEKDKLIRELEGLNIQRKYVKDAIAEKENEITELVRNIESGQLTLG